MKKIRVLHIITRLDPGGSTTNTLETVARLDPARYEVELVSGLTVDASGEAQEFIRARGIKCVFVKDLIRSLHPFKDAAALVQLVGIIRSGKYDIVHTHSSKAGILGRLAARIVGVRHVVHTPHGHVFYGYFSPTVTRVFVWLERWAARMTDRLIALTAKGIEDHLEFNVGRREQWVAIPSGIDMNKFTEDPDARVRVRREIGVPENGVLFVSVSRLEPVKGNIDALEAFAYMAATHPEVRLVFVGDGAEREMLLERAKVLCTDGRVIFVGRQQQVVPWLSAADVLVLASLNEGMGRAALEAMACGRPVIASNVGGLPDLVKSGQEGFLIPAGDTRALAEAMTRLTEDGLLRQTMSVNARRKAGERFSIESMVARIDEVYCSLMTPDIRGAA